MLDDLDGQRVRICTFSKCDVDISTNMVFEGVFSSWKMEYGSLPCVPKILSRLMVGIILYTYAQYLRDYHVYHLSLSSLEITMNQPLSGISHDFPLGFRHFSTLLMSFFGDAKTPLRSWRIRRSCTSSKQRPSLMRMKIQRYECWQVVDLDLFEMPVDHC